METPVSLLERLRQPGEQQAWARFVELYTPLLFYWARRLGLSADAAADLVQDVFVVLVRKLPEFRYDPQKSFRSWLRTVTHNKWRESLRHAAAGPTEVPLQSQDVRERDAAAAFEETEYRTRLVRRALQLLRPEFPPNTWMAFQQHVIEGRSAAEVAAELNLRLGSIYAAKSRVLTRLRQEMDGLLG